MYLYRLAGTAPEAAVCRRGRPIERWTPRLQNTGAHFRSCKLPAWAEAEALQLLLSSKTERMKTTEREWWEGLHLKPENQ